MESFFATRCRQVSHLTPPTSLPSISCRHSKLLLLSRINRLVSRAEPQHQHHHKHRYRQSLHRHRADNLPAFFPSIHRSIPSFISAALRLVSDRWIHPPTLPDYGTCRFLSIRLRHGKCSTVVQPALSAAETAAYFSALRAEILSQSTSIRG